jgi:hypothetical protein
MSYAVGPEALDDRSVLLVLQEISAQLGEDLAADEETVQTEDEARLLLAELLHEYDVKDVDPSEIAASETDAQAMARRTLSLFTEDPSTAPVAQAVVEDPPEDEQLVIETAIAARRGTRGSGYVAPDQGALQRQAGGRQDLDRVLAGQGRHRPVPTEIPGGDRGEAAPLTATDAATWLR